MASASTEEPSISSSETALISGVEPSFSRSNMAMVSGASEPTSISVVLLADTTGASDFVAFTLPKVKITSDDPDDGEKAIVRTYNFTAEYNADGGSGVSSEATIMTYQDSAAA